MYVTRKVGAWADMVHSVRGREDANCSLNVNICTCGGREVKVHITAPSAYHNFSNSFTSGAFRRKPTRITKVNYIIQIYR